MEQKLYELLGIKKFKTLVFKISENLIWYPIYRTHNSKEVAKEKAKKTVYNTGTTYKISKGFNLDVLRDHKKKLLFNVIPHLISLTAGIDLTLSQALVWKLFGAFFIVMNTYCIMLQRYNQIRINKVIKKFEGKEKREIEETKKVILEESKGEDITLTLEKVFKDKEIQITIDKLITKMSLEDLKKYNNYLKYIKANQIYLDALNNDNTQILPLSDNKHILRMKYNGKNI